MNEQAGVAQLQRRIELLERENAALLRKVYGDTRNVVLTDEQYLAALLQTRTFRWTKSVRSLWGKLRAAAAVFRR